MIIPSDPDLCRASRVSGSALSKWAPSLCRTNSMNVRRVNVLRLSRGTGVAIRVHDGIGIGAAAGPVYYIPIPPLFELQQVDARRALQDGSKFDVIGVHAAGDQFELRQDVPLAIGPVSTMSAEHAHPIAVPPADEVEAVVFDFICPLRAGAGVRQSGPKRCLHPLDSATIAQSPRERQLYSGLIEPVHSAIVSRTRASDVPIASAR